MPWAIRMLLIMTAVALPLTLYVALRVSASVGLLRPGAKRRAKRIALLVIVWLFSFPLLVVVLHFLGHPVPRGELFNAGWLADYLLMYPQWVGLIIVGELIAPFLLLDIASLAGRLVPARVQQWRKVLASVRLVLAVCAILYVPARILIDTTQVRDSAAAVRLKNLPVGLEDLRITLVGDIQVDRYTGESKVNQVLEIVRRQNPDLLLSSGDVVTGGTNYLTAAERVMCSMKGSLASVAVMGDHDQWSDPDAIRRFQVECGWMFLENEHMILHRNGKRVLITGITHIYSNRLDEARLRRILDVAPGADLKMLLVHQPAEWLIHLASEHGYDLVVAGHTHGGQVVLHPLGFPVTPSMRETEYYSGTYTVGPTAVVVTNGVGLSLAPIRYHARAEITTIVLTGE